MNLRKTPNIWNRREFFLAGVLGACGQMQVNRPPDPSEDTTCQKETSEGNGSGKSLMLETRDGRCIKQAAQEVKKKSTTIEENEVETSQIPNETDESEQESNTKQSTELNGLKVTIDVGHGFTETGWDPGAVAKSMIEYELNRITANQAALELRGKGAKVTVLTYATQASGKSLQQKGLAAAGCDLFVSVHHNSVDGLPNVQGTEVYYHVNGSFSDKRLAEEMQQALLKNLWGNDQTKNRGAKSARLAVLGAVPKTVGVACLTEAFFISNKDMNLEKSKVLSKKAGTAIAEAAGLYWTQKAYALSLFVSSVQDWPILPFPEMATEAFRKEH